MGQPNPWTTLTQWDPQLRPVQSSITSWQCWTSWRDSGSTVRPWSGPSSWAAVLPTTGSELERWSVPLVSKVWRRRHRSSTLVGRAVPSSRGPRTRGPSTPWRRRGRASRGRPGRAADIAAPAEGPRSPADCRGNSMTPSCRRRTEPARRPTDATTLRRLHLSKSSVTLLAKGWNVTSAGWQVTLCDPMWHVSCCSGVATLWTAIHLLLPIHSVTVTSLPCQLAFTATLWYCWNTLWLAISALICLKCFICLQCFDAVGWVAGRAGIWPTKNWVVGCWHGYLSAARCRLAYGLADATATHCLLLQ